MKKKELTIATERQYSIEKEKFVPVSQYFGEDTFSHKVMKEKLPKDVFKKIIAAINEDTPLDEETANVVAHAMKEWALEKGATHFAHWFQPMTGITAEKHDAFVDPIAPGEVIERFSGKQLVQGEPDASSFPSGGIRATFEARGYTAWDISSPAFIKRNGISTTLCIPTVFISYTGQALDKKTPLLRSIRALNKSATAMLKLLGAKNVKKVYSNLGPEQEYFLIDMDYYYKRQDLVLSGRTVVGAPPAKGQELEDQYFGSIKERVSSFMHDAEEELFKLGIPAKTRHNEVAPSQYEIAPVYEEANLAIDHNQLVMETLRYVAKKHRLAALLHEKPFAKINGSGKHVNWSLSDNNGNNLLNPGTTPQDNIQFLVFLIATVRAVYKHADILRASVASYGNDHRLGANEAPPAIISVFLGEQLTQILECIEKGTVTKATNAEIIDLGISSLYQVSKDNTDRNRTSPFAFTGNKFEFRAVGSSQSISTQIIVLNTIVAESIDELAEKIKAKNGNVNKAVFEVLKEEIKEIKPVLFNGDNYSKAWEEEAAKRGLPNEKTTPTALKALVTEKALSLFEKYEVLSRVELKSRQLIHLERYMKDMEIEVKCLHNICMSQIIPAAVSYQKKLAEAINATREALGSAAVVSSQVELLKKVMDLINNVYATDKEIRVRVEAACAVHDEQKKAEMLSAKVKPKMDEMREYVDALEGLVDDEIWPLPKFWEILFIN
ncbi:MAG: glutamine synthetase III [Smithellaceae bacterium]|nr:glutamine synthetase III [Syntrophaceae bacterium]HOF77534.1 glutamine synthetase III [Smithellaceae bacterium]MBP8608386.1 glutamine synthetase III [Syntrophaceae bacterium]HOM69671.1 glutamine synthetase III [Smithellaceae bacterium]HOS09121.1 glutamine synthetase III [Smithellaceae bacterium]